MNDTDKQSQPNFSETSMRDFLNILFRQKKKIIVFFFSVMIVVSLVTFLGQKVYRSKAVLLVRLGRESVTLGPAAATGKIVSIIQQRQSQINDELQILRSRGLAEEVVEAVGVGPILKGARETLPPGAPPWTVARYWARRALEYPGKIFSKILASVKAASPGAQVQKKDAAIRSMARHLDVETEKESDTISIYYKTNDPRLAHDVLDRYLGFYLKKHLEVYRTAGAYAFFDKRKENLRSSLARTEEQIKALKDSIGTGSIPEQRRILMERIGELEKDLAGTESSAAASKARVKSLQASLARLPETLRIDETTGFPQSAADALKKNVHDLELQEYQLLTKYKENTVPIQQIRRRIKRAKALLLEAQDQNQRTTGINKNYQDIQLTLLRETGTLSALVARAQTLGTRIKDSSAQLGALNEAQMRLDQLNRTLGTQEASYRKYAESLEQAGIDHALEMSKISNISIVQAPSYPGMPIRPKKLMNLLAGLLFGLFGGLGLAFFFESQDHSLRKPEDVGSRLHLPIVAAIPVLSGAVISGGIAPAGRAPIHAAAGCELLLGISGNGAAISNLLPPREGRHTAAPIAIALVGCRSGEGVSTASAFLATELAQRGEGRVLLVDANPASPCQHLKFGVNVYPGLSDFGSQRFSDPACTKATTVENLDILTAGNGGSSANAFRIFSEALSTLRREYGVIICDLPALYEHSTVSRMAGMLDGVVLVVEAEKTRWEVANKAREELLQANAKILGVILNKRRFHIPEWVYRAL